MDSRKHNRSHLILVVGYAKGPIGENRPLFTQILSHSVTGIIFKAIMGRSLQA